MTPAIDLLQDGLLRFHRDAPPQEGHSWEETEPEPTPAVTAGPCRFCGNDAASLDCRLCGRAACAAHRWVMLGLCHDCVKPEEMKRAREPKAAARPELDVKWVED